MAMEIVEIRSHFVLNHSSQPKWEINLITMFNLFWLVLNPNQKSLPVFLRKSAPKLFVQALKDKTALEEKSQQDRRLNSKSQKNGPHLLLRNLKKWPQPTREIRKGPLNLSLFSNAGHDLKPLHPEKTYLPKISHLQAKPETNLAGRDLTNLTMTKWIYWVVATQIFFMFTPSLPGERSPI